MSQNKNMYFIQAQGDKWLIKIGKTGDTLQQRLKVLNTGSPLDLLPIAVAHGDNEADLHERFAHLQVKGEWYEPAPDLLEWLKQHTIPLAKFRNNTGTVIK